MFTNTHKRMKIEKQVMRKKQDETSDFADMMIDRMKDRKTCKYTKMSVPVLKELCGLKKLKKDGKKVDLVKRLKKHDNKKTNEDEEEEKNNTGRKMKAGKASKGKGERADLARRLRNDDKNKNTKKKEQAEKNTTKTNKKEGEMATRRQLADEMSADADSDHVVDDDDDDDDDDEKSDTNDSDDDDNDNDDSKSFQEMLDTNDSEDDEDDVDDDDDDGDDDSSDNPLANKQVFEVEAVLDAKGRGSSKEYLVSWVAPKKGDPYEDTWEPASGLATADWAIAKFEKERSRESRRRKIR